MSDVAADDAMLSARVAALARSGDRLGTNVRVVGSSVAAGTADPIRDVARDGLPPSARAADETLNSFVAGLAARKSPDAVSPFVASNPVGFMLADPKGNVAGYERQMAAMRAVRDPADLQTVLRVTANRRKTLEEPELLARTDAIMAFNPDKVPERLKDPSVSRDAIRAKFAEYVATQDFKWQRTWSEDPTTKVVPEAPVATKRMIAALSRGYDAIARELRSRGILPEVMVKGASIGRSAAAPAQVVQRKVIRDGMEF
jgi:hypothetical protein